MPREQIFVAIDPAVLVAVVAIEALLFARLFRGLGASSTAGACAAAVLPTSVAIAAGGGGSATSRCANPVQRKNPAAASSSADAAPARYRPIARPPPLDAG